ncbi:Cl- channel voltage-gated family protein [[Leptolyngbya] sp. PCC 7376]|uniref:chloride channel protein n=1 Tax=[Leptolyngbya] sp. PCC 7376 TaxID=111781 RepID=UPI00029F3BA7|nr:chloride channel protein [[Leptolyngbya] sp. PCC 7376]AFY38280.1 Cl- channel voltage-gated family protein [[Leptolyngbya] sp. PCC 7376]
MTSSELANEHPSAASAPEQSESHQLTYTQTVLCAAAIGLCGGLVATIYYFVLETMMHGVWEFLPEKIEPYFPSWLPTNNYVWIATTIGGLCVGLVLYFMGLPGEMAQVVDRIHQPGRIDINKTPAMVIASLIAITAGGSAGPEAPLVQVNGSLGSWLGDTLKLSTSNVRLLTFCGMSAALGAFFGAPIGAAIFALEIPHRRGLEYYEAVAPAVVSAICSFAVFRISTGMTIGGFYHFETVPALTPMNLLEGFFLGIFGAGVAVLFIAVFRLVGHLLEPLGQYRIGLATFGGLSIGLIAFCFPQTLFFSETQIHDVIETGMTLGVSMLLLIAVAKMFAISFTLHSGFLGGFIFPLFFIGANVGLAIAMAIPQIHPTVGMVCLMAAVNVAVTKTPVSTSIILSVLSGTAMLPVIVIASFTSFLLTTNIAMIRTQRERSFDNESWFNSALPKQVYLPEKLVS